MLPVRRNSGRRPTPPSQVDRGMRCSRNLGVTEMHIKAALRQSVGGLVLAWLSCAVWAMPPRHISAEERNLLPPYCKYTQGGYVGHENPQRPSAEAKRWVSIFGGQGMTANLWRMHHYCYALIHLRRGQSFGLTPMEFKGAWMGVIEEIDFTLQFLPQDFVLMPEMMLNRARALMRLKKPEAALADLKKSVELKPDYWPPYLEMADYYFSIQDKSKAIEILQDGLKHAPDAKALRLRLAELGGKASPRKSDSELPQKSPTSAAPPESTPAESPAPQNR